MLVGRSCRLPKFRAKVLLASSYHLGDIPARTRLRVDNSVIFLLY